ncbi:hypothetical protein LAUMK13_05770 [Mycobacterium innocens]|uniref:Uncharacterized protein n=1 Tax=Mycobacterium innocens TaxID=2341083 RepID=A0A498QKK0_9MYCO|nr:hypothetical protein LAUMK13_05770 [Mycobacterium innocens]
MAAPRIVTAQGRACLPEATLVIVDDPATIEARNAGGGTP